MPKFNFKSITRISIINILIVLAGLIVLITYVSAEVTEDKVEDDSILDSITNPVKNTHKDRSMGDGHGEGANKEDQGEDVDHSENTNDEHKEDKVSIEHSVSTQDDHQIEETKEVHIQEQPNIVSDITKSLPIEFISTYSIQESKLVEDVYVINEDQTVTFNPLSNDRIRKSDDYRIVFVSEAKNATIHTIDDNINFKPNPNFNGKVEIEYILANKQNETLTSSITVEVRPQNDAPKAKKDILFTEEDTPVLLSGILANDTDVDGDNIKIINVSTPKNGHIDFDSGIYLYTPNDNFNGLDEVEYTISDEKGYTSRAKISILVKSVGDDPKASDDNYETNEDEKIILGDVLKNDSDADNDIVYIKRYTEPAYGVLELKGKFFHYTPKKDFHGVDTFNYTISDTANNESTATVRIVVKSQNDAPVAVADNVFKTNQSITLYMTTIISNDKDVDGDVVRISSFTNTVNGTVEFDGENTFAYTPNTGYFGIDRFSYTVTDGKLTSDLSEVSILIEKNTDRKMDMMDKGLDVTGSKEMTPESIFRRIDEL